MGTKEDEMVGWHLQLHEHEFEQAPGDGVEKAMATHSSTLAWKIPWMEEPGGLQSRGRKESDTTERLHSLTHSLTQGQRDSLSFLSMF